MEYIIPLIAVWSTQLLAAMSPGASFILISKLSLSNPRPVALSATLGLGLGTIIWASAAIAGVAILLEHAAWAYTIFKFLGGLYLLFLAFMVWHRAKDPVQIPTKHDKQMHIVSAFMLGLFTQLANPKVIVFFGSIFVALLPQNSPLWVYVAAVIIMFINEVAWYAVVALLFSVRKSRDLYIKAKTKLDRLMAGFLSVLGLKLIIDQ